MTGLYGAIPAEAERFRVFANGAAVRSAPFANVAEANAVGVAYVPADRRKEGLLLPHSIDFNLLLPLFASHSAERRRRTQETAITERLAQRLTIRGDRRRPAQALSGGNQQKVALSKWLTLEPSVLLLNDPTRGVDVETKREIYLALRAMAAEGKAVVLLSTDTPELVHLCDRVIVFNKGRVAATLPHAEASEEAIVAAAMGVRQAPTLQGEAV
jgi:ribose transport system ATP-binding protein